MEQEQTPKQVQPEDTKTFQTEEPDAKRELNTNWVGKTDYFENWYKPINRTSYV